MAYTLLIADDDRHFLTVLQRLLTQTGHNVHAATNGPDALSIGQTVTIDACILDVALPLLSGPEVARQLKRPTLFISGRDWDRLDADTTFPTHCLRKPVSLTQLVASLDALLSDSVTPHAQTDPSSPMRP